MSVSLFKIPVMMQSQGPHTNDSDSSSNPIKLAAVVDGHRADGDWDSQSHGSCQSETCGALTGEHELPQNTPLEINPAVSPPKIHLSCHYLRK